MSIHPQISKLSGLLIFASLFLVSDACAAKIGELSETNFSEQFIRFFSFKDPSVRYAVLAALMLGTCCGLLGSFIVVRKLSLMGDTLSHAVLPGVALGFLWTMTKNPWSIFIGATIAGLLGTVVVHGIHTTTHIKEDSAMGIVLSGFYAIGICLHTMIQHLPNGNKAGLDKFMFGQAAALSESDLVMIAVVTGVSLLLITLFYKEFLVTSFDNAFASSIGMPAKFFHYQLMLLLAFSVVVGLQAVGIVLVSAMLITPAATAYLLTDRMHRMLILASVFGMMAGIGGAFFSYLGNSLPTGPFMIVSASTLFGLALLFGPRYGIVPRWVRQLNRNNRIQIENTLKAVYQIREKADFKEDGVSLQQLGEQRNLPLSEVKKEAKRLIRERYATLASSDDDTLNQNQMIYFTPSGWENACRIVRNHRLWELYLTKSAHYQPDHVHDDAEEIEHVLGENIVRELERLLDFPTLDPHGKRIPSVIDLKEVQTGH
ncbi:metal ABC transporter permease [Opitutia bacterium ISCC 51]|nr:metal ABC transporter permease [Opitutae bacterium ISCC 51]QXD29017.1 metal ABC transporter permease [Opitutae bacterium ISCC 52]